MAADPQLQIIVKMKDLFTKQMKAVQTTVTRTTGRMRTTFARMGTAVSSLQGKIGLLIGAYVTLAGAQKAWGAIKTYGKLASVRGAFELLRKDIDMSAGALDKWRKTLAATAGDSDILTQANKAMFAGFVKTAEDFDVVAYAARQYGRRLGEDVLPALEQMVQSIAAASPKALKPLGIDTETLFRLEQDRTGVAILSQKVKMQIMLDALRKMMVEDLKKGVALETTISETVQQTAVHWGNVEENIGEAFAKAAILGKSLAKTAEDLTGNHAKGFAKGFAFILRSIDAALRGVTELGEEIGKTVALVEDVAAGKRPLIQSRMGRPGTLPPVTAEDTQRAWNKFIQDEKRIIDKLADSWDPSKKLVEIEEVTVTAQQSLCDKMSMYALKVGESIGDGVIHIAEKTNEALQYIWGAGGKRDPNTGELKGMGTGLYGGLEAYGAEVMDVAANIAEGVRDILRAMEDSIGEFFFDAMMGKLKTFKDYLRSFLTSTAKILSQFMAKLAMAGLGSAFNSIFNIGGSSAPTTIPTQPHAAGGVFSSPHIGLIAEGRNAEAIVPLPDNRSIPVTLKGGGTQAPPVTVNFNISATDGASVQRMLYQQRSMIKDIIRGALGTDPDFRSAVRAT